MAKKPKTKRFTVEVKEVWCHAVEVKLSADATRDQIVEAAQAKLEEGDDGSTEYDYTLDPDRWNVRDEGGNFL
jgi:hypothetical protein